MPIKHTAPRLMAAVFALAAFFLIASTGGALAGTRWLDEFRVNDVTGDDQTKPALAPLAHGGFVSAWISKIPGTGDCDIRAQVFDNDAHKVGGEILITSRAYSAKQVTVVGLTGGGFAVAWDLWANNNNGYDINGQVFDPFGTPLSSIFYAAFGSDNEMMPRGAPLTNGSFALTWTGAAKNADREGHIYWRRFNLKGEAYGDLHRANNMSADKNSGTAVVGLYNSASAVFWDGIGTKNSGWNVYGQKFDADGNRSGDNFVVHRKVKGIQWYPSADVLDYGKVVVTWVMVNENEGGDIYGRIFNNEMAPQGEEFLVRANTTRIQACPRVANLGNDNWVVVYERDNGGGDKRDVYAQKVAGAGNLWGGELAVNAHRGDDQDWPQAARREGGFVITWESFNQDGGGFGVFGQMYY